MQKDGERFCDGCSQKLPGASKLSYQTMPAAEAQQYGIKTAGDAPVVLDLCLQCRLKRSEAHKRG